MRTIIRNNYDPHIGDYHERIIQDEAREKTWLFDCDGVYLDITAGRGDVKVVNELGDSETDATSQKLVTDELGKKQDTLTAGDNITIEGNVISAAGKNYSAGYGLTLNDTEFAANTSVLATQTDLAGKQDTLTTGQLAAVNSGIDSTKVGQIATNTASITTINGKIPAQATSSNQLADKDFVNSSIATNTANFIGTFNSVAELEAYSGAVTNNDYAFVIVTDAQGNTAYDRYKYNGSTSTWLFEYELNNSSFTADQWASINSGITDTAVTKLSGIEAGAEVNVQSNWNETDADSDAYIQNKPTIPTVNNATLTIQKNSTTAGTFTANSATDTTINLTVPTTAADVSALPASTKYGASITVAIDTTDYKMTTTLKDQDGNTLGSAQVVDLPLESVVVNGAYDSLTKEVVLTLQNGNTIRFSVADLVSGLQSEITAQNKLSADLVDDSTTTNKFVTATDKTTWDGKQNALTAGSNITISGDTISATDTTYSDFVGATSGAAGSAGLVPAPASGDTDKYLKSDGSWATVSQYTLPAASANTLGGVKIGSNLSMDANDVLSATDTTYTAGTNVSISSGNVISATDTTYSNFVGTDGQTAGTAGLVPAPATTDAGKFLKADGSWTGLPEGITTLTTDDYNWPTDNPTSVALWLLPAGVYKIGSGLPNNTLYANTTALVNNNSNGLIFIAKSRYMGWEERTTQILVSGLHTFYFYQTNNQTGANIAPSTIASTQALLKGSDTQDNLTSTSQYAPLSANMGRELDARIGNLSTLTTTAKTSTVAAINELDSDLGKVEPLSGSGAPTTSTAGVVGQFYVDTATGDIFYLSAIVPGTDPDPDTYTWNKVATGSGGPTVVQTTGTSTTDVMSQDAVTSMVFADPATKRRICIGASRAGNNAVAIGIDADAAGDNSIAFPWGTASYKGQVQFGVSQGSYGYHNSPYRLLTGLYDGQSAHDAATLAQGNTLATTAPTTSTVGVLGQLYTDTTNMHTYQCTAIDTTDPSNPSYTWTQRW